MGEGGSGIFSGFEKDDISLHQRRVTRSRERLKTDQGEETTWERMSNKGVGLKKVRVDRLGGEDAGVDITPLLLGFIMRGKETVLVFWQIRTAFWAGPD